MRIDFTRWFQNMNIDSPTPETVKSLALECSVDPRLSRLSAETRWVITQYYDSDVDEAAYDAAHIINTFRNPPLWVLELQGATRHGWRDWEERESFV